MECRESEDGSAFVEFGDHAAVVRRLREALEWIDKRCPRKPLERALDEKFPHQIHIEMAYDAGNRARAALEAQ